MAQQRRRRPQGQQVKPLPPAGDIEDHGEHHEPQPEEPQLSPLPPAGDIEDHGTPAQEHQPQEQEQEQPQEPQEQPQRRAAARSQEEGQQEPQQAPERAEEPQEVLDDGVQVEGLRVTSLDGSEPYDTPTGQLRGAPTAPEFVPSPWDMTGTLDTTNVFPPTREISYFAWRTGRADEEPEEKTTVIADQAADAVSAAFNEDLEESQASSDAAREFLAYHSAQLNLYPRT